MSGDPGGPAVSENTSFEASIRRLAQAVEKLEQGDLPLDEAIRLFEEGARLARTCQTELDAAEKKVEELLAVTEDGAPVTRQLSSG